MTRCAPMYRRAPWLERVSGIQFVWMPFVAWPMRVVG